MSLKHCNPNQFNDLIFSEICKIGFRVAVRPKKIRQDGRVTVVFWSDGTTTAVRRSDDDADNLYNAFCAALAKKVFGNNTALKREIDKAEKCVVSHGYRFVDYDGKEYVSVSRTVSKASDKPSA